VTRVYLPVTPRELRVARELGVLGPGRLRGHAVTTALVAALPGADEEEQEYAALTAAAVDSLSRLGDQDLARRVVVAVDVDVAAPSTGADDAPSAVVVDGDVPLRLVAALLVDSDDASPAVSTAVVALAASAPHADEAVERCLDHELGWFAAQEIDDVLAAFGTP